MRPSGARRGRTGRASAAGAAGGELERGIAREFARDLYGDPARLAAGRGRLLILGHRGLPGAGVENRLETFQAALDAGADGVEFDVQLSADGVPMVIHDASLRRTTGKEGLVTDFGAAELAGFGLPRLEAVLDGLRPSVGARSGCGRAAPVLNIELKDFGLKDRGLERKVADLVTARGAESRVLFSSFNPLSLARIRAIDRRFYTAQLTSPGGVGAAMRLGYLWHPGAVHPHFAEVTPAKLGGWRRRGWRVVVWGADTEEQLRQALAWDIDGIITDRPAEAVALRDAARPGPG